MPEQPPDGGLDFIPDPEDQGQDFIPDDEELKKKAQGYTPGRGLIGSAASFNESLGNLLNAPNRLMAPLGVPPTNPLGDAMLNLAKAGRETQAKIAPPPTTMLGKIGETVEGLPVNLAKLGMIAAAAPEGLPAMAGTFGTEAGLEAAGAGGDVRDVAKQEALAAASVAGFKGAEKLAAPIANPLLRAGARALGTGAASEVAGIAGGQTPQEALPEAITWGAFGALAGEKPKLSDTVKALRDAGVTEGVVSKAKEIVATPPEERLPKIHEAIGFIPDTTTPVTPSEAAGPDFIPDDSLAQALRKTPSIRGLENDDLPKAGNISQVIASGLAKGGLTENSDVDAALRQLKEGAGPIQEHGPEFDVIPPDTVVPYAHPEFPERSPWEMSDEEFKGGGWSNYEHDRDGNSSVMLPSEYKQIEENEGETARNLVYELNQHGIETLDTHNDGKYITIHLPNGYFDNIPLVRGFLQKHEGYLIQHEIGDYLNIPVDSSDGGAKQPQVIPVNNEQPQTVTRAGRPGVAAVTHALTSDGRISAYTDGNDFGEGSALPSGGALGVSIDGFQPIHPDDVPEGVTPNKHGEYVMEIIKQGGDRGSGSMPHIIVGVIDPTAERTGRQQSPHENVARIRATNKPQVITADLSKLRDTGVAPADAIQSAIGGKGITQPPMVELRHYTEAPIQGELNGDQNGLIWFTEGQGYLKGEPKELGQGGWGYITKHIPENQLLRMEDNDVRQEYLASPYGVNGRSKAAEMAFAESRGYSAVSRGGDVMMRSRGAIPIGSADRTARHASIQMAGEGPQKGAGAAIQPPTTPATPQTGTQPTEAPRASERGFATIGMIPGAGSLTPEARARFSDSISIDAVPGLTRAAPKSADAAVAHAYAPIAAKYTIKDLLAKSFPDIYKDPAAMQRVGDVLVKDNILGGYDQMVRRANDAGTDAEHDTWMKRAEDIAKVHDLDQYQKDVEAAAQDPAIKAAIDGWKQYVNPYLDGLYNETKAVDPNTQRAERGRNFGARVNLVSLDKAAQWADVLGNANAPLPQEGAGASSFRNPNVKRDPFAGHASFLGDYTNDPQTMLAAVVGPRWTQVTKLRLYNQLVSDGVASWGEKPADLGGKPAVYFPVDVPSTNADGVTTIRKQPLWLRADMVREVRDALNTDLKVGGNKFNRWLTNLQLFQLADLSTHMKNLTTVLTRAQGAGNWQDIVRKLPLLGSVDAVGRTLSIAHEVAMDTPQIRAEMAEMAKWGGIRPDFPSTGVQKITHAQDLIHQGDTASRIAMNRFYTQLVADGKAADTISGRRRFIDQVGQYNRRLMTPFMRTMKDWGLSPFVVAGRNFNRQGVRWLTGNPGVQAASMSAALKMRSINLMQTALLGTVPMMVNMATSGSPLGRPGTPIGAIDLGMEPDKQGRHKTFDLLQLTGVKRGMRALGLNALAEGIRNGLPMNQIVGDMMTETGQTVSHPWMGPAPAFVYKAATGKQPDLRGRMEAKHIEEAGARQYLENTRAAIESQNPMLYSIVRPLFQAMNLGEERATQRNEPLGDFIGDATNQLGETPGRIGEVAGNFVGQGVKSLKQAVGVRDVIPKNETAAERYMANVFKGDVFPTTPKQRLISTLAGRFRAGEDITHNVLVNVTKGLLTEADLRSIGDKAKEDPLITRFTRLNDVGRKIKAFGLANPDEREKLRDHLSTAVNNAIAKDPGQKEAIRQLLLQELGNQ